MYDTYGNRTTETTYNSWGTGTAVTTGDGRQNLTTYDATSHTFPIQVMNAANQSTCCAYNYGLGKVLTTTDPNNAVTTYQYDGFGRAIAVWAPYDLPTSSLGAATVLIGYQGGGNQPYRYQARD